jgi:hypothetical protein
MVLIGVNEELLTRGIILHLFLDRFKDTRAGILLAVFFSSLIFGETHMFNVFSGVSVGGALIQSAEAAAIGSVFAAVYIRSNNIWITVIAHALIDFAALMPSGLFAEGTIVDTVNMKVTVSGMCAVIALFLMPTAYLLRPEKLDEIIAQRKRDSKFSLD